MPFKRHKTLLPIPADNLTQTKMEKEGKFFVPKKTSAHEKLPPKENYDLEKMIASKSKLERVNCKIILPATGSIPSTQNTQKDVDNA